MSGTTRVAAGEEHIGAMGGATVEVTGTFTRDSTTSAYAANDVVNDASSGTAHAITIASAARVAAGSGIILSGRVVKSTNAAAASGLRLWLFLAAPATIPLDNAAFQIAAANKATRIGYIDLTTVVVGSDCVEFYGTPVFANGLPFKLTSGTSLFGILQTLGAFTPANAEVFDVYLNILQD